MPDQVNDPTGVAIVFGAVSTLLGAIGYFVNRLLSGDATRADKAVQAQIGNLERELAEEKADRERERVESRAELMAVRIAAEAQHASDQQEISAWMNRAIKAETRRARGTGTTDATGA